MNDNRMKRPFSKKELDVVTQKFAMRPGRPATCIFNAPISYRENVAALFWDRKPCFAVNANDFAGVFCKFFQDKLGRCHRDEGNKVDAFGVKWVFEPTAGGSISVAGNPRFTDVSDWKDRITMPDVNEWDWEADAAANPVDTNYAVEMTFVNGFWFERLISLMDFINAAMALVDDDQTEALNELFEATTQLGCDIVDKVCTYWPAIDGFVIHDDWGSQKSPFFSDEIARNLFLPHMKKLVSHIHSKGRYCSLHSCGNVGDRVDVFIDAGIDTWQMQANANDAGKLYEKYGDKIIMQITIPAFDVNDEKAAIQAARDYVDNFCKPGKPTIFDMRNVAGCRVFEEAVYEFSRKAFLMQ